MEIGKRWWLIYWPYRQEANKLRTEVIVYSKFPCCFNLSGFIHLITSHSQIVLTSHADTCYLTDLLTTETSVFEQLISLQRRKHCCCEFPDHCVGLAVSFWQPVEIVLFFKVSPVWLTDLQRFRPHTVKYSSLLMFASPLRFAVCLLFELHAEAAW